MAQNKRSKGYRSLLALAGLLIILVLLPSASPPSIAADGIWTEDFAAAQVRAEKEGKDLLLDFTGSDWCGACIALHREILSKAHFQTETPKDFVLVTIDFPETRQISAATKAQNAKLQTKHNVSGFPTIILADAKGNAYATMVGYTPGMTTPEKYVTHLKSFRIARHKIAELRKAAAATEGIKRARILDQIIEQSEKNSLSIDASLFAQIIALDPGDQFGLKTKYRAKIYLYQLNNKVTAATQAGDVAKAFQLIDAALVKAIVSKIDKQKLLLNKAILAVQVKRFDDATAFLKLAKAFAPDSEIGNAVPDYLQQVAEAKAHGDSHAGHNH